MEINNRNLSHAQAGEKIIAGDNNETHNHFGPAGRVSKLDRMLRKLHEEYSTSQTFQETIESLKCYYEKKSTDGIDGLEGKLKHADREHEIIFALGKKEQFEKMLETWSHFSSAQEIIAYLLSKIELQFNMTVPSAIDSMTELQVNSLILNDIINPIVEECGDDIFKLDHGTAMGMAYWLAEKCYIRWHK